MSPAEFESALASDGYAPAVRVEKLMGYEMDEHQHPFDAFALIIAGEIVLQVNGQYTTYAAGSTFKLQAGTVHRESAKAHGVTYLAGRRMQAENVS